jgi:polyisoprenoid-binding protein YceI
MKLDNSGEIQMATVVTKMLHLGAALALTLGATVGSGSAIADDYKIDTRGAHAFINFKFNHLGYSWLTGEFRKFGGTFTYDPKNVAASKVRINIDMASIDSNHAARDKHIRSDDYLDTSRYPQAEFASTRVEDLGAGKARVHGYLSLHGVTREISFEANIIGEGKDPWGGYRAGFEAYYTLNTKDFGMDFAPSQQVELGLLVEGVRQR